MRLKVIKFLIVGIANNALNFLVVFFSNQIIGLNAFLSASIGFIAGSILSFTLNSKYTFNYNSVKNLTIVSFFGLQLILLFAFSFITSLVKYSTNSITISWLISTSIIFIFNFFLQSKFIFKQRDT